MKDSFTPWALTLMGSLLTAYLYWASNTIIKLENDIALLKWAVFKTVATAPKQTDNNDTIQSSTNLFEFILKKDNKNGTSISPTQPVLRP